MRGNLMDMISDLGSDLAIAFLVEKKHSRKIAMRDALTLIGQVRAELQRVSAERKLALDPRPNDALGAAVAH